MKDGDVISNDSLMMLGVTTSWVYRVEMHEILIGSNALNTPARINNNSGIIELQLSVLRHHNIKTDFVYWLIIWCEAMYLQDRKSAYHNIFKADKMALAQYLKEGRSKKHLMIGLAQTFINADTAQNRTRYERIKIAIGGGIKFIKECT